MTGAQLDIFGDVEAADARAVARLELERQRAALLARATTQPDGKPVIWTSPYGTPGKWKPGEKQPGARCWLRGGIEINGTALWMYHGLKPEDTLWDRRTICLRTDPAGYENETRTIPNQAAQEVTS